MEHSLLLLVGPVGSGKTTYGACLEKYYGYERLALADELKIIYSKKHDVPLEELHDRNAKEKHRPGLIRLADEIKKEKGENYFVDIVLNKIKSPESTVITDVRFKHELARIKNSYPTAKSVWFYPWSEPNQSENIELKKEDCDEY